MSYIEFLGTLFTAYSVYLAGKNKIINWPIGIIGTVLYGFLFYQVHLYSDFLEQIYYFITGFWGWYVWLYPNTKHTSAKNKELAVTNCNKKQNFTTIVTIFSLSAVLGYLMSIIHIILPTYFPEPASYAYIDAFTTVASFAATIYLVNRKIENW